MRFVAGRGAAAELLQAGNRRHRGLPAGALQRRAIGKMLPAGSAAEDRGKRARQLAPARKATCRKGAPSGSRQGKSPRGKQGKSHPVLQANKKESGKTHSLKPALVMTALVRVTGARPRGSSQLPLCSLELLW